MSKSFKNLMAICLVAVLSMMVYGCGGGGGTSAPPPVDQTELEKLKKDARDAAARVAKMKEDAGKAIGGVDGMGGNANINKLRYAEAIAVAKADKADLDAADTSAQTANTAVQAATDLAVAKAEKAKVDAAEVLAGQEANGVSTAVMFAGYEIDLGKARTDAIAAAAEARMKAGDSTDTRKAGDTYTDADGNTVNVPVNARTMANYVTNQVGANSPASKTAEAAATAAETAATAAEKARDAANDADKMVDRKAAAETAKAEQAKAEAERDKVVKALEDVEEEYDRITNTDNLVKLDRNRREARAAANAAEAAAKKAKTASDAAKIAKDNAASSAEKAKLARTDYETSPENAKESAKDADDAAKDAKKAADEARTAADAAKKAADDAAKDGTTADKAEEYRIAAEGQQDIAEKRQTTAETKRGEAESAETAAMKAWNTHVLGLFKSANAYSVVVTDPANVDDDELKLIAKRRADTIKNAQAKIADAAQNHDSRSNDTDTANRNVSTATATYPHDADLSDDKNEAIASVTVDLDGDSNSSGDAYGSSTTKNTDQEDGLPSSEFKLGFDYSGNLQNDQNETVGKAYVLAFTDIAQQKTNTTTSLVSVTDTDVAEDNPSRITDAGPLTTTNNTQTFTGKYDHDEQAATKPLSGTFTCMNTCTITRTPSGGVTAMTGDFTFTGSRTDTTYVAGAADSDYLVFGVWLTETTGDNAASTFEFGAFADGNLPYVPVGGNSEANWQALTGTATYRGAAAGVHSRPAPAGQEYNRVDWFHGDATLNAQFGNNTTQIGTISGRIENIVSHGEDYDKTIYMDHDVPSNNVTGTNIAASNGTFSGSTRMGEELTAGGYKFSGSWQGQFYGAQPAADSDNDAGRHPGSVAGTFGVTNADESETFVGAFGAKKQ